MMLEKNKLNFTAKFFICLLVCLGGGWLTGLLTQAGVNDWYPTLIKPSWTPPNILFPLAWSFLYILMALSLSLVWNSSSSHKTSAFIAFGIQLFLNFIWTWLFFYLQKPGLALIDITLLWFAIVVTIGLFFRHSRYASYLLIPYLGWVTYAFCLNFFIWNHN